jgi:hypothetical protein
MPRSIPRSNPPDHGSHGSPNSGRARDPLVPSAATHTPAVGRFDAWIPAARLLNTIRHLASVGGFVWHRLLAVVPTHEQVWHSRVIRYRSKAELTIATRIGKIHASAKPFSGTASAHRHERASRSAALRRAKEAGWVCGSRLGTAVAWLSSGVLPGGRRRSPLLRPGFGGAGVGRAASSVCRAFHPQGLCAGTLLGHDCRTGRSWLPSQGATGQGNRKCGRSATPLPSRPSVARRSLVRGFVEPGALGRVADGGGPGARLTAHIRWSAACGSCEGERSVKPSAQPTLVRTQHLPPPAKTAR